MDGSVLDPLALGAVAWGVDLVIVVSLDRSAPPLDLAAYRLPPPLPCPPLEPPLMPRAD
jgi:hypothetical protein